MVRVAWRCCASRSACERLQMADGCGGGGGDGRRQRRGEDEARRIGAHGIDHRAGAGDVAAERAERLGQRAFDDVDAVGQPFAFGDAAAARSVHADGMDLVDIGHGVVALGEVDDLPDRRDVAIHRIDALEDDQLGALAARRLQQAFEMRDVVVAEDLLLGARAPHALDHRGVVQLVGDDQAVGQKPRDGRDRRLVGDEAGGEDQRCFLAVQVGKFQFELDQRVVGAGNVAGAAGARAHPAGCVLERGDDVGVLAHAEIVVGAPDGDFLGAAVGAPDGAREFAGDALEIGEDAVAALCMELVDRFLEEPLIIHVGFPILRGIIIIAPFCVHRTFLVKMPRPKPVPNDRGSWPIPLIVDQFCFRTMPWAGETVTDLTFGLVRPCGGFSNKTAFETVSDKS